MTTNVYDISKGLLSTDSRWSKDNGEYVVYIDNTGYDKIVYDNRIAILFAGDLDLVDVWKKWFHKGKPDPRPKLLDDVSLIIVSLETGMPVFKSEYTLTSGNEETIQAVYGGTGGVYAKNCWEVNSCAITAVNTAIKEDLLSGGEVVYLNRNNLSNNIKNSCKIFHVNTQLKETGTIMNMKTKQKESIQNFMNSSNSSSAQALVEEVISGNAKLSAPFVGKGQPWSNEKIAELDNVLERFR